MKIGFFETHSIQFEISRYFPHKDAMFIKLKAELCPEVPVCPTRWTVHAASMESVILNYAVLQALWGEARGAV